MEVNISPGKYVLAVSGGVDSMALLHLLVQQGQSSVVSRQSSVKKEGTIDYGLSTLDSTTSMKLVVAHFNHGIRPDSLSDERLVVAAAKKYGLPVEVGYGALGKNTSEEEARYARYNFLEVIKEKYRAKAIITAHHQDDLIETAFINIIRGTGRQGLSSIQSKKILRPLLSYTKKEILRYARQNNLKWHEDRSNKDTQYLRNYIRQKVMSKLGDKKRAEIFSNLDKVAKLNIIIDKEIATLSQNKRYLNRRTFTALPTSVGNELLAYWFRQNNFRDFDRRTISRVSVAIRTAKPGTKHEIIRGRTVSLSKEKAALR